MRLFLQRELSPTSDGRSQAEMQGAMELEYELSERDGEACALLHVAQEGLSRLVPHPERWSAARRALLELCAGLPRRGDLLVLEDQGDWVVLLARTRAAEAEAFAAALIAGAHRLAVPGEPAPRRLALAIGLAASQPDLELHFEVLRRVAREGAEVASLSGDGRVVHTQLYALHQRALERLQPNRRAPKKGTPAASSATAGTPGAQAPHAARAAASGSAPVVAPAHDLEALDARVRELAEERARAALAERLAELEATHAREVELLERRIQKLNAELAATEENLRRAARALPAETGLASVFRSVQGLDGAERGHAAKLTLLGEILEANLLLRRALEAR